MAIQAIPPRGKEMPTTAMMLIRLLTHGFVSGGWSEFGSDANQDLKAEPSSN